MSGLEARQLWGRPTATEHYSDRAHCTPFTLPSNGVVSLVNTVITLSTDAVFQPECTGTASQGVSAIEGHKEPFYASTIPQTFVIAAATVLAWVLVVMLVITPRTSFFGQVGVSPGFGNGHGIIGGATGGSTSLIGIGSRPWLQKVATLTVAISLTIATSDTFRAAHHQYSVGYMDATLLRNEVMGSLEIRITRVVSDVFLWLAQVQTLIRLFPRHKEKVLIKWIGFALIVLDSTFSCLNSFLIDNTNRPRHFEDAIPALSYLFELALSLLYAAWVIYYSLTKRRYAFYHQKMRNICLIALLSLVAILTPGVFFVTDVSNPDVAGWGDYFRWVGAAAASVVVWEWVERIEALERDEKKDGILGREIFDGDEMLDVPAEQAASSSSRQRRKRADDGGNQSGALENGLSGVAQRFRRHPGLQAKKQHFPLGRAHSTTTATTGDHVHAPESNGRVAFGHLPNPATEHRLREGHLDNGGLTPPPAAVSPVSRADTTSAASTVYVVRYDTVADIPQPVRRRVDRNSSGNTTQAHHLIEAQHQSVTRSPDKERDPHDEAEVEGVRDRNRGNHQGRWHGVSNPFKRKRASPPTEVQQARQQSIQHAGVSVRAATPSHNFSRWDVKNRLGVLAAEAGDRIRDRAAGRRQDSLEMPLTVIPAQPRGSGRTWSPQTSRTTEHVPSHQATNDDIVDQRGSPIAPTSRTSDSTTLTANSTSAPDSNMHGPMDVRPGATDDRPAGPTKTSGASNRSSTPRPPRADDVVSLAGGCGSASAAVVVPAPRRSPLRMSTPATLATVSSAAGEDGE